MAPAQPRISAHLLSPAEVDVEWIFGYGSLIWNPEIDYAHAELGRIHGYHRAFCIRSLHYRGTPQDPGVVLGLDRGGSCTGLAYQLHATRRADAVAQIFEREIPPDADRVYLPRVVRVCLRSGVCVNALTFVADHATPAYVRLSDSEILKQMMRSHGKRGPNIDYLFNTLAALESHGVHDRMLTRLAALAASRRSI